MTNLEQLQTLSTAIAQRAERKNTMTQNRNAIFVAGDRVHFYCQSDDTGTVRKVVKSRYCPSWDKAESTPLTRAISWHFVEWDSPARPGATDPETWWPAADLCRA